MSARNPPCNGETYIALGDSIMSNEVFHHITVYEGSRAWMEDEILNMGLEALYLDKDCQAQQIGMINTNIIQICKASWVYRDESD
jgi:hypothetical protein